VFASAKQARRMDMDRFQPTIILILIRRNGNGSRPRSASADRPHDAENIWKGRMSIDLAATGRIGSVAERDRGGAWISRTL
jgi:hypothetical protein